MKANELAHLLREINDEDVDPLKDFRNFLTTAEGKELRTRLIAFRARVKTAQKEGQSEAQEWPPSHELSDMFLEFLEAHPSFSKERTLRVGHRIFAKRGRDPALNELRRQSLEVLSEGAVALAASTRATPNHVRALVAAALGADAFSSGMRSTFSGMTVIDPDLRLPAPGPLQDLLAEHLLACVTDLNDDLEELRDASANVEPARAWATGISKLDPNHGCAGTGVTISGSGFGDNRPPNTFLYFPKWGGGCIRIEDDEILEWSETRIVTTAPSEVGIGCIGFVSPAQGEVGRLQRAASHVGDSLVQCFGPPAKEPAQLVRMAGQPIIPCPECLLSGANHFSGGRPFITYFLANLTTDAGLVSDAPLALSWRIEGAERIEITPARVDDQRNQLPPVTAPLDPTEGTVQVGQVPGTYPWTGAYELRAWNECTSTEEPETAGVRVEMHPARSHFMWGVSTAGHQVEGRLTNDDWYHFTTDPSVRGSAEFMSNLGGVSISLQPAGDAVNHRSLDVVRADIERAALLGANAYRFSVEWSRVEPVPGEVGDALEHYYVPLVRLLRSHGLEPIVTLNHLTLPEWVSRPVNDPTLKKYFQQSLGGWLNPETVDRFIAYVERVVSRLSAEGVRFWLTLNEPVGSMIVVGYVAGVWPPGFVGQGGPAKTAYFNLLKAHVRAYDAIKTLDPRSQISIAHNVTFFKPPHQPGLGGAHIAARNQMDYFFNYHFLDSVTSGSVDTSIYRKHLPSGSTEEEKILGAFFGRIEKERSLAFFGIPEKDWTPKLDFIGINYYRSVYPYRQEFVALFAPYVGGAFDMDLNKSSEPRSLVMDIGWEIHAEGLFEIIMNLHDRYGLPIMITENGVGEAGERYRPPYTVAHVREVERAARAGATVLGYIHWSLLDNFEWQFHYEPKASFGLLHVDRQHQDPEQGRTLPRRMTEGALAFQYLTAEKSASAARRFGTIDARFVRAQEMSPGSLWRGREESGHTLALYLGSLDSGAMKWLGMIFDYLERRWVRLDDVVWDPYKQELSMFHRRLGGRIPEREYTGHVDGNRISGIFSERISGAFGESLRQVAWQVDRVLPHGVWDLSLPFGPLALSNIGKWEDKTVPNPDVWTGRLRTPSVGTVWQSLPHIVTVQVAWDGASLDLRAAIPHPDTSPPPFALRHGVALHARVSRSEMNGTVTATDFPGLTAGAAWSASRLGDGVPF